jgi:MYXO-CTERM domain-containing protein
MCQSPHWPQAHDFFFGGGGIITAKLHHYAMNMPLRTPAHHSKRLSSLLAAPAVLLLSQGQAQAILTYNIFESAGNVVVQASGSLNLSGASFLGQSNCGSAGAIRSAFSEICTGPDVVGPAYSISGPSSIIGTASIFPASNVTGISTALQGSIFNIDPAYTSNSPIISSATFNGATFASLGFTTTGLIGTWTLGGTSESIQVILVGPSPSGTTVPGPLPLLGAGAAFGWSRRLRKRITTPLITPPQA